MTRASVRSDDVQDRDLGLGVARQPARQLQREPVMPVPMTWLGSLVLTVRPAGAT